MATISSIISSPSLIQHNATNPTSKIKSLSQTHLQFPILSNGFGLKIKNNVCRQAQIMKVRAVATEEAAASTTTTNEEGSRRVYIGNIPRDVTNDQLRQLVEEHGAVDKAEVMFDKYSGRSRRFGFATMKTVEDANAVVEKLNDTEIGGRKIKVNISEKPLSMDSSVLQAEDSQFVDSPHKVYVGNLAKTVTTEMLKEFFSEKGQVLSAKVQRTPGTSKSSGFGFVCFSSDEEAEAAISALNNAVLEGQKLRVNKA